MHKKLTSIPRTISPTTQSNTFEWEIPGQVSVAFTFIDKYGYTLMAKVKVEKKHFWNRSWRTFTTNASTPTEAFMKGLALLENYGYTINHTTIPFEEKSENKDFF